MNGWIAIWPIFVAEYFPQFRGTGSDFLCKVRGLTLIEFRSFSDLCTVDPVRVLKEGRVAGAKLNVRGLKLYWFFFFNFPPGVLHFWLLIFSPNWSKLVTKNKPQWQLRLDKESLFSQLLQRLIVKLFNLICWEWPWSSFPSNLCVSLFISPQTTWQASYIGFLAWLEHIFRLWSHQDPSVSAWSD